MVQTTAKITESLKLLEDTILENMDIPKTVFHKRAIDYFINNQHPINERLLIRKRLEPSYVKKDALEQFLLDDRRHEEIMRLAEEYKCGKTILLFQILLDYCCAIAPAVLDEQLLKSLGLVN